MKNKGNSGSDEEIIEEEDKCVYDQFLDELKFYSSCPSTAHEPQSDDSLTDVDSGYTTARHSAIPEERTINQPRKTTKIVRCLKYDVKQRQQKLIERRELRRNKPLNLQTIAWHLLDFVSPKLDPDYKLPRAPCIFQVVDDKVYVQKAYQASKGYFEQHMAQSFLQTHRNWSILSDFADTQREVADKPAFVICWLEIYDEFVYTFVREITKLKSNCHDPITALRKGKTVCDVVDFLTSIINPVRAAREWKFENIELAWSLMLAAISEESVLSPEKKNIALKLQCAAFSVFLGAMDMLYYFGEIPSGVKSDFIIYRDSNNPTNFECHPTPAHSVLWSRQLIKTIHRGAVLRQRLGNLFNLDSSSFSAEVRALLPEWETQLIPTHIFRRIFHCIAVDFTDRLGQELFSKIMGAGLLQLWRDMKNITIGASSTLFATAIFNLEVAVSPEKAFQNSLKAGNVSSIAKWRREVSPGHTGELHFEVSGVLTHLIGGSLIKTINAILDSWLKLYRMHFILVAVISDNKLLSDSRATLRRQFCFVTSKVYNVLVIVRNHFYYKINQIFIEVEEQIKVMTTYYDVEKIIKKAEHELMNLIDAKHDITTKNILGVINTFSNLIDDIRLKSLSNDVHGSILHEWRKSLLFTQESIRSLGMHNTTECSGSFSPVGSARNIMQGYLNKLDVRAMGLVSKRRHWFALSDASNYLYWYKDPNDIQCIGRLSLRGAAFTYNPVERGRFEIHAGADVYKFEANSQIERDEWLEALQASRKTCLADTLPRESTDIISLSSTQHEMEEGNNVTESTMNLFNALLGPRNSVDSDETLEDNDDRRNTTQAIQCFPVKSADISEILSMTPSSTFYLDANGDLNDKSMEMPEEHEGVAEAVLRRLSEKTADNRAIKVIARTKKTILNMRECEECKKKTPEASSWEERCHDLEDHVASLENMIKALKTGLFTAQRQIETMKDMESISSDEELKEYLLDKERQMTKLQMDNNSLNRKIQDLESDNRELDLKVNELLSSVDAFRESVRTKEELIMRLFEEHNMDDKEPDEHLIADVVGVPEALLLDQEAGVRCDEEAEKVFEAVGVKDINELKDLVEGYKVQNRFLSNEVVALHSEVENLLKVERDLNKKNFEVEACYYQLKSRYLMVLNHFKSPEKPGKIMEPGVLRQLLEEFDRAPRESQQTDTLGFYLKGRETQREQGGDLLDVAAGYMETANNMIEARSLEQSEEYMMWLQSWDGLLVNWVGRQLAASPELKTLVRTGVPPAYRSRVWKALVNITVKDKLTELGNGYFQSMLRKATNKIDEGIYDSAIKQIDLDLARTLPTNKFFDEPSSIKIEMLRRVLYAFRYHNKVVGYCQGLNRLAAVALLYLDEEDAFWFMVACVEYHQPEGYYTSSLIGAVTDQKVLRDLVTEKLPKLAAHLRSLEVDLSLFTLSWFLTCFVDILPHSVYLNIFDVFLYEGNKAIFRFALALLKKCEASVLQCKTIGTVHACLSRVAECVTDFKTMAQIAFNDMNPFPQKLIETKRVFYLNQLREQGYS